MIRINTQPGRRQLRQFAGLVFPLFSALVGALAFFRFDSPLVASWIWVVGVAISLVGLALPPFARIVYLALTGLTYPIGFVVSHLVLLVIYYGLITPVGLALRLADRDPLRKRPGDEASYWRPREAVTDAERYFRQY